MKFDLYISNNKKTFVIKIIIINILIYFLIFFFLYKSKTVSLCITECIKLFTYRLVPALFPFLFITEFFINTNRIQNLSYGFTKIISRFCSVSSQCVPCVVIGFLLGYPNSAKYILNLYSNKQIDNITATKLTAFTSNANMAFIISAVGISMFGSVKIGIILCISHYLSAIVICLLFKPTTNKCIIQQKNIISNSFNKIYSPFEAVTKSILGSMQTLAIIFGYTVIFSLIPSIIFNILKCNEITKAVTLSIFEISNGLNAISILNLPIYYLLPLASFMLSFSSFMIIFQIFTFVSKAKVKLVTFIKFKLLQGIISCIITLVITGNTNISFNVFSNIDSFNFKDNMFSSTIYIAIVAFTFIILYVLQKRKKRQV